MVMRHPSSAAEALILNARSQSHAASRRQGRADVAIAWIEQAIAAGCDPVMQQQPISAKDLPGEWLLVSLKQGNMRWGNPGKLASEHFDEAFVILARLGRIHTDAALKPWHGNVLLDDSAPRAVALRVRLVREALGLDHNNFYGACGINLKAGEALEEGNRLFASLDHEILHRICAHHDIPEDWVMFGMADEIEA
jgi:hypothetical protein